MSSSLLVTLEIAGVLGVILLLGGWELWQLRKDKKQDQVCEDRNSPKRLSQETPSYAEANNPSDPPSVPEQENASKRNAN